MLGLYGISSIPINAAMKIIAKCDKCNSSFSVNEKFVGRKAKCSKCGGDFIVQAAHEALEPQGPIEAAPAFTESSPAAAPEHSVYSLSAAEPPRCPNCQKILQPKDILCVNCGYDLLTRTQVQFQKDTQQPIPGGRSKARKRKSYDKSTGKAKRKAGGRFPVIKAVKAGVLFGILVASVACIWGGFALYRNLENKWNQHESLLRLDYIFSEKHVNAKKLAQELPYVYAYMEGLAERLPKEAESINTLFLETIPKIPKDADLTPLLQFPPESSAYLPILNLLEQSADLQWQMQKSCDPLETARHYGADLLMATLPFVPWTQADKNSLRERTSIEEKQRRFRKYAEQSQHAAEKILPGRYYLQLETSFADLTKARNIFPNMKETTAKIPEPVMEAISKDKTWKVSFFGRTWTGSIEQFGRIDLACPVMEHGDIFKALPFFDQLQHAVMHLRFKGNEFAVEIDNLPMLENMTEYQRRMTILSSFNGFHGELIKAPP